MAHPPYNYSVAADTLNGLYNGDTLTIEIDDSSIAQSLLSMGTEGDTLGILFPAALTSADETTLDGLIAAHAGDVLPSGQFAVYFTKMKTISSDYTLDCVGANVMFAHLTVAGNLTLSLTGLSMNLMLYLMLKQDATGGRVITLSSDFLLAGGAVTLTTAANAMDNFIFMGSASAHVHEHARALDVK